MNKQTTLNRRNVLKGLTAGMVAAAAGPTLFPTRLWGADAPGERLNIALVGCGGRGLQILQEAFGCRINLIALCDVDQNRLQVFKDHIAKHYPAMKDAIGSARGYSDYRELLAKEKTLDGVLIAIGPWWHAPMSTAFINAGKHVYCEKPLTHNVHESRALGELARKSKVATQMGTQGVASEAFRRAVEAAQAGILGKVSEIHAWNIAHPLRPVSCVRPEGADPIPAGFDWDLWQGPAQERPYKKGVYQPGCMTTAMWLDYGMGLIGDFGVHTWQLPIRALKLGYPTHIEHNIPEEVKETYVSNAKIRYDFPGGITGWYYDTVNRPPQSVIEALKPTFGELQIVGALTIGENGMMYCGGWCSDCYLKLKGDEKFSGVGNHPAVKAIEKTEPRSPGSHIKEWVEAALAGTKSYQSFEMATRSMEIILPSLVSLRLQRPIDWDGANMKVPGCPEADRFIHEPYRTKCLV
jgi:hypothetical protein